jgi:undecaprenyl-diphosphatase
MDGLSQMATRSGTHDPPAPIEAGHLSQSESATWRRRAMLLIAVLLVGRWLYAACVPLELIADEAYYWDWSRRLDWCYYSKPPMVAWLIRLATDIGGSDAWVVRTPAVWLGTIGLWWMYLLAARMFDARVGFWAVVLCAATPGNAALGLLMTIDAPFLFCWGLAMYCVWRFLERRGNRAVWIVLTGVCAGLGLLSKESMLAFLMATWLFLLLSRADWCEWRRPGCAVMTGLALAMLTPVLVWNSQHDWVTFQHSATHFELQNPGLGTRLVRSVEFLGSQLGVISPVTCLVFLTVAGAVTWHWRRITRPVLFLMCFSVIPLSAVFVLSLTRRVQPNWPAPFYGAGLILTAAWLLGRVPPGRAPRSGERPATARGRLLAHCVWCGIICVVMTCLAPPAVIALGWGGTQLDPTFRLRGWKELADRVAGRQATMPHPRRTFMIVTTGRREASELAFYLPEQPDVLLWNPGTAVLSQYDLWPFPTGATESDALILTGPATGIDPQLAMQFRHVEPCETICVSLGNSRSREYALWLGRGYRSLETAAIDQRDARR